ncbi:MAG TPA: dihydrofolate reductase family protein [Thermoleophilaceae bacterium]|nr:dihydrofolate reductase family protein [Thermoleophilaceae bacterium]
MTTIKAVENVTLDGVMEAPEDWSPPYQDEVLAQVMARDMARGGGLLFGRRTYEEFIRAWAGREDNPFTPVLEAREKYVVSRTLSEPLPWQNSTLVRGDVAELKRTAGEDQLVVLGSGELLHSLLRAGLVDELLLTIHPLVLGSGKRLFEDGGPPIELGLTDSVTTTTGVTVATYHRARA